MTSTIMIGTYSCFLCLQLFSTLSDFHLRLIQGNMAASVSTNMSFASTIDRDFDRTPSPRFWNRIDESFEASEESLTESSEYSGEIGYTTEEENNIFMDRLTAAWENRDPLAPLINVPSVRRAIDFSPRSPSLQVNRGFPQDEQILNMLGVGVAPRTTEAEEERQRIVDSIVAARAPSVASGSEFDFPVFVRRGRPTFVDLPLFTTADPTSVFDGVDAFKINKRARSSTVASSSVPPPTEIDRRVRRRVTHNALVICTSCNCQHLVDIDDALHVCVFCGHSTRTIDVNIRDHVDDV